MSRFVHVQKLTLKIHNFQIKYLFSGLSHLLQFEVSDSALHFLCRFVHYVVKIMSHIFRKGNICHIWFLLVRKIASLESTACDSIITNSQVCSEILRIHDHRNLGTKRQHIFIPGFATESRKNDPECDRICLH